MDDPFFDDITSENYHVEHGVNDTYTENATQYVKRSKIKQTLIKIQSQDIFYTDITEHELQFYIDYIYDIDDKVIDAVWNLIVKDIDKGIQKLRKLKHCPNWCKKP